MKKTIQFLMSVMLLVVTFSCSRADGTTRGVEGADEADTLSVALTPDSTPETDNIADLCEETDIDALVAVEMSEEVSADSGKGLRIAMAGDIMMGTTFPDDTPRLPANGGRNLFDDVKSVFTDADVVCANLEGVLMEPGGIAKEMGEDPKIYYIFRMPEAYVNNLADAGIDFVSVANNHSNDMQAGGRRSTKRVLDAAGIAYAGQTDCPTAVIERGGKKIGIAAFGHSAHTCHTWNYDNVRRTVAGLDSVCDIVIVSFHGGAEGADYSHVPHMMEKYLGEPRGDVERFAHTAIDAGADVVYGHGPHVTRAVELYKDRFIIYSLGNFCTPYRVSITGTKGYAPVVTVDVDSEGRFTAGKIHSFIQQPGIGPRKDTTGRVAKHIRELSDTDFPASPLSISDDGVITPRQEARMQ